VAKRAADTKPTEDDPRPVRRPATPRPKNRREMILAAASELFKADGYEGVGMKDIGDAVGVTAPAIYAHFNSKAALLTAVLERAMDRIGETVETETQRGAPPLKALDRLILEYIRVTLEEGHLGVIHARESRHLGDPERSSLARKQRAVFKAELDLYRRARPDLPPAEARLRLLYVFNGLITAGASQHGAPGSVDLLRRMAMAALMAP
jgi:AcrR family transcriptional regulator